MKLYTLPLKTIKKINPPDIIVAIYGLGKMGLPLAVVFAAQGFKVIGVDLNSEYVKKINEGFSPIIGEKGLNSLLKKVTRNKQLQATIDGIEASRVSDIKIIIVPTYTNEVNTPDLSMVKNVTEKIAKGLHTGDIVILESTAPPGTTMNLIGKTLERISGLKLNKDFSVAHCPERTSSGTAIADIMGRPSPKIVGGSDKKTTEIMKYIYSKINKRGVIPVGDTTTAELIKLWEGIYRDVNIAFANNLYLICRELGVNAVKVIEGCNTDKYCNILTPGPGVGGHCIPVYPYFILKNISANKNLLTLARKINDSMSKHVISLAKSALEEKGVKLHDASILILGLAYRSGVKETRKSPGLKIATELLDKVKKIYVYDPLFDQKEIENFGFTRCNDFSKVDCIVITTDEQEFKNFNWRKIAKQIRTKAIVDTKNIINLEKMKALNFAIRRIGYAQ